MSTNEDQVHAELHQQELEEQEQQEEIARDQLREKILADFNDYLRQYGWEAAFDDIWKAVNSRIDKHIFKGGD